MAKILVTGAAGFIGYFISEKLSRNKNDLIILVDNLNRGRFDDEFKKLTLQKNVKFIQGDLADYNFVKNFDNDFDYIYHLAAVIGVKNVENYPDKVLYVNSITILNLFEKMKEMSGLKKFFFSSTSEIYAGTLKHFGIEIPTKENVPLSLDDIKSSRSTYALTKMFGESVCFNYGNKYNIPFTIVRYHNVYGPRMGFAHVIPETFVKIKNSSTIKVPSPNHSRAFCFVDDAVEYSIRLCKDPNSNKEIFNIGNSNEEIKIKDLVALIAKIIGKEIIINELDDTLGSPQRRCPDTTKLINFTNYYPIYNLKDGLKITYDWYKNKLNEVYE
ncbi:MAG: NAD-dependent epimerase/dehydratase family protein [Candidatus Kapabacteria bacterium]|nr:NAD-dependent epimerase/dehydratase family protein [Candidatus Kapabacteria bacterium]